MVVPLMNLNTSHVAVKLHCRLELTGLSGNLNTSHVAVKPYSPFFTII